MLVRPLFLQILRIPRRAYRAAVSHLDLSVAHRGAGTRGERREVGRGRRAADSTTIKLTAFNMAGPSTGVRKRPPRCIWLRGGSTKQCNVWNKDKGVAKIMLCLN